MARFVLALGVVLLFGGGAVASAPFATPDLAILKQSIGEFSGGVLAPYAGGALGGIGVLLIAIGFASRKPVKESPPFRRSSVAPSAHQVPLQDFSDADPVRDAAAPPPAQVPQPIQQTNLLVNGDFSDWPSGEAFVAVGPYQATAAGWLLALGGGGAGSVDVSRVLGPPQLGKRPISGIRVEVREAGSGQGWFGLTQSIPNVATLAGQTARVAFLARASDTLTGSICLIQDFGLPDENRQDHWASTPAISVDWAAYSVEIAISSIDDRKSGESSNLTVFLSLPTMGTYWIEFADVQLSPI